MSVRCDPLRQGLVEGFAEIATTENEHRTILAAIGRRSRLQSARRLVIHQSPIVLKLVSFRDDFLTADAIRYSVYDTGKCGEIVEGSAGPP